MGGMSGAIQSRAVSHRCLSSQDELHPVDGLRQHSTSMGGLRPGGNGALEDLERGGRRHQGVMHSAGMADARSRSRVEPALPDIVYFGDLSPLTVNQNTRTPSVCIF